MLGCNPHTVMRAYRRYNIAPRHSLPDNPESKVRHPELYDREWLHQKANVEDLSDRGIARLLRMKSHSYVAKRRRVLGVVREKPRKTWRKGPDHPAWKGGRKKHGGYIYVYQPEHPRATSAGYVLEHRLVMEKVLGHYLGLDEVVHHINGIRDDNRPENLIVFSRNAKHMSQAHSKLFGPGNRCPTCGRPWPGGEAVLHE